MSFHMQQLVPPSPICTLITIKQNFHDVQKNLHPTLNYKLIVLFCGQQPCVNAHSCN